MSFKRILNEFCQDKKYIKQNALGWIVFYSLMMLLQFSAAKEGNYFGYIEATLITLIIAVIFYINYFLCALFFDGRRKRFWGINSLFFLMYLVIASFLISKDAKETQMLSEFTFLRIIISCIIFFVIIIISTLIWSLKNTERKKEENRMIQLQLENKNLQLVQEKTLLQARLLKTEIDFLRAQINPHFLFNCLNFFYSEMLDLQPKVADGVITLSQIMRYSLQDFSKTSGMASLEDELEHINNIIKIHQMRFNNSLHVKLNVEGNAKHIQIAPMVLITLVENVFKHGNLADENIQSIINCKIDDDKGVIHFSTINKKKQGTPSISTASGIGLANIRQRMEQLYENNFSLEASDETCIFKVELDLPFQNKSEVPDNNLSPTNSST